ncbi:MAG: hypothetical protein JXB05_28560 [Myxococcaceae bacterium]|nr:hypothetical protein [Myxococcaceae bacterium]
MAQAGLTMIRSIRWWARVVGAVMLVACKSGQGEAVMPAALEPTPARPARQDPGMPAPEARPDAGAPGCASCGPREQCVEGRCVCQPLTCSSGGRRCGQVSDGCGRLIDCGPCSRCGPQEMDCCGICIPRSEKRCPDNVHCPTPPPEM